MDIVDAQIHMGPGGVEETLRAMDALGIGAVLVDELWLAHGRHEPSVPLAGGARRPIAPTAQLAAQRWPERFGYLLRVEPADPDHAGVIRQARDAPHAKALRICPGSAPGGRKAFAEGGYDAVCAAACDAGLPLFVFAPDVPEALARCARAFPGLRLVVDHCGIFSNAMRPTLGGGAPPLDQAGQLAAFEAVLALADFDNVALKWAHASAMFEAPAWPGEGLWPILRKAVDRFGPQRVMWASDYSVNPRGESWAELLFGVRANPLLTPDELGWVLGRAARAWLDWAPPDRSAGEPAGRRP